MLSEDDERDIEIMESIAAIGMCPEDLEAKIELAEIALVKEIARHFKAIETEAHNRMVGDERDVILLATASSARWARGEVLDILKTPAALENRDAK